MEDADKGSSGRARGTKKHIKVIKQIVFRLFRTLARAVVKGALHERSVNHLVS